MTDAKYDKSTRVGIENALELLEEELEYSRTEVDDDGSRDCAGRITEAFERAIKIVKLNITDKKLAMYGKSRSVTEALTYVNTLLAVPKPEVRDPGMQRAIENAILVLNDIRDDIINNNKRS